MLIDDYMLLSAYLDKTGIDNDPKKLAGHIFVNRTESIAIVHSIYFMQIRSGTLLSPRK